MTRYKKLNTDWNSKLFNVLQNKENNFENKLNEKIERIENKHLKERKFNTEPNMMKNKENLTYKLEKISFKMGLKSEVNYLSDLFFDSITYIQFKNIKFSFESKRKRKEYN